MLRFPSSSSFVRTIGITSSLLLMVTLLLGPSCLTKVDAFTEDIYFDASTTEGHTTESPTTTSTTTTTTTTTTARPSPPPPFHSICYQFCKLNLTSCKSILNEFLFGWVSSSQHYAFLNQPQEVCRYSHDLIWSRCLSWASTDPHRCPPFASVANRNCPRDSIISGFGFSAEHQARCMPLSLCKYFSKIFLHVNEMHEDVHWI